MNNSLFNQVMQPIVCVYFKMKTHKFHAGNETVLRLNKTKRNESSLNTTILVCCELNTFVRDTQIVVQDNTLYTPIKAKLHEGGRYL